ncbi:LpqB family beta-propeller domain-containing protein [Salinispora oceanensis]|uniref:LpqB family beta-propeller domain-containing protein n=1 Tax=Salinispora oceanensis TaxID=1050199 RepID=UPI0003758386|nr:LpqB family beta-propeller domain-containing protein [Salinispora oceanensis]
MSRQILGGLLGGVLLVTAAGCGIPSQTEVRSEGPGPAAETGTSSGGRSAPPSRTTADSREEFVDYFLAAAAGEPDGSYDRVSEFVVPEERARLPQKEGSEVALTVVRLVEEPVIVPGPEKIQVTLTVQQVGQLTADGVLGPPEATPETYEFGLSPFSPEGGDEVEWYVTDPPNVLLLSVEALQEYYKPWTIYFWSSDRLRLVPDQRYLARAVPEDRLVSEVVRWLVGGHSAWLKRAISGLPDGTKLINNATRTDDRWEVNLDMTGADRDRLRLLATQLVWSLPELTGQLELKIRNQSQLIIEEMGQHRRLNPVYQVESLPQPFCIYEGAIRSLGPAAVPVAPAANDKVFSAGISRSGQRTLAALTVDAGGGRQRLAVEVGSAPLTAFAESQETFRTMSRPLWLRSAQPQLPVGLVVADGQLYRFDEAAKLDLVQLSLESVTAVAAALDGHRLAIVSGGELYLAAVSHDGDTLAVGPPRRSPTSLTGLTAVDWYGENSLVLAGAKGGKRVLYEVGVDGARETNLHVTGAIVTHLTAYPAHPEAPYGTVMYEANEVAYQGFPMKRITPDQVRDIASTDAHASDPSAPLLLF